MPDIKAARKGKGKNAMKRRKFLAHSGLALTGTLLGGLTTLAQSESQIPGRPNILLIMTDQQTATAMSCAGNGYLKTPK